MLRFGLGLLLGLGLTASSSSFDGMGHGTWVPVAFASSVLAFMADLGPIIPSLGTPILWSLYFLLIPDIDSRGMRLTVLVTALGLHILTGLLFLFDDAAGMSRTSGGNLLFFFVLLLISMSLLVFVSFRVKD